jgi:dUTP pyrophosphatase
MLIKITRQDDRIKVPERATVGSSGYDIAAWLPTNRAFEPDSIVLRPGERALISTGLSIEMPIGVEGQVRPRSGLAVKSGVTVLNAPGTIDSDYRGEVKVLLINHGEAPFEVTNGMRIAQLVFMNIAEGIVFEIGEELGETVRGAGGFGHTGGD